MTVAADPTLPHTSPTRRYAWLPLVLITLLAAALRLSFLSRPGVWGDEAATYGRVNGSFYQLLEVLQYDGFAPLHYELYWVFARFSRLTPVALRLWPAIAGTLTVPAMYFLARQLVSRRTALTAALLSATSAYLLYYSRDAKMYAPLWLFVTLSMGCLLAWLNGVGRTKGRLYYWCWIFSTTAAAGIHTPGLAILAIAPFALILHPRRGWLRTLAFLVGIAVILAGPVYHYTTFNRWAANIESMGWNASMLQWVEAYNRDRELPQLIRYVASEYATGWEWPDKPTWVKGIHPTVLRAGQISIITLGLILLVGAIPWTRLWRWLPWHGYPARENSPAVPNVEKDLAPLHPLSPQVKPSPEREITGKVPVPQRLGHYSTLLLLAIWIIFPAYTTYLVSYDTPAAPWELFTWLTHNGAWPYIATGVIALGALLSLKKPTDLLRLASVLFTLALLTTALFLAVQFSKTHAFHFAKTYPFASATSRPAIESNNVWMPRYMGVVLPALFISAAALLSRLPLGVRHLAITAIVLANLANFAARLYIDPEPPVGRIVAEVFADAQTPDATATSIVFAQSGFGGGHEPGTGTLTGPVGRYYTSINVLPAMDPGTFREGWGFRIDPPDYSQGATADNNPFNIRRTRKFRPYIQTDALLPIHNDIRPKPFRDTLARRPNLQTVIFWERGDIRSIPRDPLGTLLGKSYKLTGVQSFPAYDHWTWLPLSITRRYEYTKLTNPPPEVAPTPSTRRPTSRPAATRPTTRP